MDRIRHISIDPRLAVALGAGLGTGFRAGLHELVAAIGHSGLWATFAANIVGSLLLGLLLGWRLRRSAPSKFTIPFFGIGLLGSFTTFSLFAIETADLIRDGRLGTALVYSIGSVAAGLLVAGIGERTGRAL